LQFHRFTVRHLRYRFAAACDIHVRAGVVAGAGIGNTYWCAVGYLANVLFWLEVLTYVLAGDRAAIKRKLIFWCGGGGVGVLTHIHAVTVFSRLRRLRYERCAVDAWYGSSDGGLWSSLVGGD
jgi:hypothetical protein